MFDYFSRLKGAYLNAPEAVLAGVDGRYYPTNVQMPDVLYRDGNRRGGNGAGGAKSSYGAGSALVERVGRDGKKGAYSLPPLDSVVSDEEFNEASERLGLSPRQEEVVRCLLMGSSDKQIARDLRMSVPTVRTHLGRLFSKFGIEDRVELIVGVFNVLLLQERDLKR